MPAHSRLAFAALLAASLALTAGSVFGAAVSNVECGLFRNYLAPDPIAVTPGSITFGLSGTPEAIAADATLVPPADTALPSLQGGVPTCLTVTRDTGVITAMAFAPSGMVSGPVLLVPDLFGPGQSAYVIADRVFSPVDAVTANPGLAALIKTAADSGSDLSITFQIDLTSGLPTGFDASTTLSGAVVLLPGGDIQIGAATLPSAVIGASARQQLEQAAALGVPATVAVSGVGVLDQGGAGGVTVDIRLAVSFVVPILATPTPTPTAAPTARPPAALPNTAAV
ncbi:MAG: hypothetical protein ABJB65_07340, partial [Chloroflexota bacterium]